MTDASAIAHAPQAALDERAALAQRLLDALPQTQCTRCGFPDCAAYAQAMAHAGAAINRCPPGGQEGVQRLAVLTGQPAQALDPAYGTEGPRAVAVIDEDWCIGCTLCIKACPTDAILGSNKQMHTVIAPYCNGCELCLPACPVDCIQMEEVSAGRTGWAAWSAQEADQSRQRYEARRLRLQREAQEHQARLQVKAQHKLANLASLTHVPPGEAGEQALARKRSIIEAALARAKARQPGS